MQLPYSEKSRNLIPATFNIISSILIIIIIIIIIIFLHL
jgi:hypothetical protein